MDNTANLASGSLVRTLLRFFWPLLLANLLQTFYGIVDMLVVGWYVGSVGVAAISNTSMLGHLLASLAVGLGTGGTVRIAYVIGTGMRHRIRPVVDSMLVLSFIISLPVTVVPVLGWLEPLLLLLKTPGEALTDAHSYMTIVRLGTVFVFGFNAAASLLRGMGDSVRPMQFLFIATALNIVLDFLFVGVIHWGVAGAAYATFVAQAVACLASLLRLSLGLGKSRPAPCLAEIMRILKTGVATALQLMVINASYTVITAMVNVYGVEVAAASGIGLKINTFIAMPCWALVTAITAMVGQSLGARKISRSRSALGYGLALNLGVSLALVIATNVWAESLLYPFSPGNAEVVRVGVRYLRYCCSVNCLFYCAMYTFDAFAIGAGDAFIATFVSMLDSCIRLSLCWWLGVHSGYGYEGIFPAMALAPVVPALVGAGYYLSGRWMRSVLASRAS